MRPSILIVDDDEDLRATLGMTLDELYGCDWIGAPSVDGMIALGDRALSCAVAILDINLGRDQPSGLDAFEWLTAQDFAGRIVFLTGHARSHPLVDAARREQRASVYEKPLTVGQLGKLIEARSA
ncbi:MAG TPA: response regulator [Polyangiaceae bacterium]|nr:response regulator [Polyangiaceae bacterium]